MTRAWSSNLGQERVRSRGHIVRSLGPSARFLAIELNARMAAECRERHPSISLVEDSVANARAICDREGIQSVDAVVCGLPWAGFSERMQVTFLDELMRVLKPGGRFATFAYLQGVAFPPGRRFAALLHRYFSRVTTSRVVWLNVPPAFVYRCTR